MATPVVNREHLVLVQTLVDSARRTLVEGLAQLVVPEEDSLVPPARLRHLAGLQRRRHPADSVVALGQGVFLVEIMQRSRQVAFSVAPTILLLNRAQAVLAPITKQDLAVQMLPLALAAAILDCLVVINNKKVSLSAVVQAQVARSKEEPTRRAIPVVVYLAVKRIQRSGVANNRRQLQTPLAPLEPIKIKLKQVLLRSVALGPTTRRKSLQVFLAEHLLRVMQVDCLVEITNKTINNRQGQEVSLAAVPPIRLVAIRFSVGNLLQPALGYLVPTLRTLRMVQGVPACLEVLHSPTTATRTSRIKVVGFSAVIASNNQSWAYLEALGRRLVVVYSVTTTLNRYLVELYFPIQGLTTSHNLQAFSVATTTLDLRVVFSSQMFFSLHKLKWPLWTASPTEAILFSTVSLP